MMQKMLCLVYQSRIILIEGESHVGGTLRQSRQGERWGLGPFGMRGFGWRLTLPYQPFLLLYAIDQENFIVQESRISLSSRFLFGVAREQYGWAFGLATKRLTDIGGAFQPKKLSHSLF